MRPEHVLSLLLGLRSKVRQPIRSHRAKGLKTSTDWTWSARPVSCAYSFRAATRGLCSRDEDPSAVELTHDIPRRPLGQMFVEQGLVTDQELEEMLAEQVTTGERLGEILLRLGVVSGPALTQALMEQLGVELKKALAAALEAGRLDLAQREQTQARLEAELAKRDERIAALEEKSAAGDVQTKLEAALQKARARLARREEQLAAELERRENVERAAGRVKAQLRAELVEKEKRIVALKAEGEQLVRRATALQSALEKVRAAAEVQAQFQEGLTEKNQRIDLLDARARELVQRGGSLESALATAKEARTELEKTLEEACAAGVVREQLDTELTARVARISKLEKQAAELDRRTAESERALAAEREARAKLKRELGDVHAAETELVASEKRIDGLDSETKKPQKYAQSVQSTTTAAEAAGVELARALGAARHAALEEQRARNEETLAGLDRAQAAAVKLTARMGELKAEVQRGEIGLAGLGAELDALGGRIEVTEVRLGKEQTAHAETRRLLAHALAELASVRAAPEAAGFLLFVPRAAGYDLFEQEGPAPVAGDDVEVGGRRYVVAKLGRSPLPLDSRPCAYLAAAWGS
jgi:chromosome segregation ATPase